MGGEALIRPWDWLQSTEITKQMDIEQISVNLSWERINRVKDGNLCVHACGRVWKGAGVGMVDSWCCCHVFWSCFCLACVPWWQIRSVSYMSYSSNFHWTLTSKVGENVLHFLNKQSRLFQLFSLIAQLFFLLIAETNSVAFDCLLFLSTFSQHTVSL